MHIYFIAEYKGLVLPICECDHNIKDGEGIDITYTLNLQ